MGLVFAPEISSLGARVILPAPSCWGEVALSRS
jgi:hypothetical protein